MSAVLLSDKTVTARKAHSCYACAATAIRPGEQYRRKSYVGDGCVFTWISCLPCAEMFSLVYDWVDPIDDEGIDRDDYGAWADEFEDDPEHGEIARAYLKRRRPEESK